MTKDERVLIVNNLYKQQGGEQYVAQAEYELLRKNDIRTFLEQVENENIKTVFNKVETFLNVAYSKKYQYWIEKKINQHQPTLVHVHNIFPLLTPSIYDVCIRYDLPIVQTVHNYRIACAGGLLFRENDVCEKCVNRSAYNAVRYKCYRNSYLGTLASARLIEESKKKEVWKNKVSIFIALTDFTKKKLIEFGLPKEKIYVKHNFISDRHENCGTERRGALFVGRLSKEKGIETLLEAWKGCSIPIKIIGDGPLKKLENGVVNNNIQFLGSLDRELVLNEMRKAEYLVFPSLWYEGFPLVLIEALSQGLPVVASNIGSMTEIIFENYNGLLFKAADSNDLLDKVLTLNKSKALLKKLQSNARNEYLDKYTPQANYKELVKIYQMARSVSTE